MINVRSGGDGDLPLVVVHGGSGSSRLCEELLSALPDRIRWWAVDLPGHGESPWTPGRYGLDIVGATLAEWAEREIPTPAWWYGHSYGGQAVLAAAGAVPKLFAGLVLGDTPLDPERMYRILEHSAERLRRWREWCGRPEAELVELLGAEAYGDGTFADALGRDHPYLLGMAASLRRHDPEFIGALLEDRETVYDCLVHAESWLAAAPGPVLLLRGDPAVMAMTTEEDAALVRSTGGTVRSLAGVGHGLHHFAPRAVAEVLDDFIV